jgi:hypothetical protein
MTSQLTGKSLAERLMAFQCTEFIGSAANVR